LATADGDIRVSRRGSREGASSISPQVQDAGLVPAATRRLKRYPTPHLYRVMQRYVCTL